MIIVDVNVDVCMLIQWISRGLSASNLWEEAREERGMSCRDLAARHGHAGVLQLLERAEEALHGMKSNETSHLTLIYTYFCTYMGVLRQIEVV